MSKKLLVRGVEELDVPNRINPTAVRDIFKAYQVPELGVEDFV